MLQAVLLFGEEMWVLNPRMERGLDSYQHKVVRRLTGRQPRRHVGWELGLPSTLGGNGGSRLRGNQEVHHEEVEHGCSIYCDATNYGPL